MDDAASTVSEHVSDMVAMLRFARAAAATGVVASALFLVYPGVDLSVAGWFYSGDGRFVGEGGVLVPLLRNVFLAAYVAAVGLAAVGLALTALGKHRWLPLSFTQLLFAGLCLCLGPGLVANLVFKDNWGRARPRDVIEFAGPKQFTPALLPAQECGRNCSFVSGEASSNFAVLFAAAALYRRRAIVLIGSGVVLGGLAGLLRMAQGAHFLSDVVFAGVFMALTVAAVSLVFERMALTGIAASRARI